MIMTQHQCGLDGMPSIVHKTILLKKYGTTNQPVSNFNISSGSDYEDSIKE